MIAPGATIGILGGGQLGRMLALAAAPLGLKTAIFDPAPDSPAFEVAASHVCASWDDAEALTRFAAGCDVITLEFENVPVAAARTLAALKPLHPGVRSLEVSQDRLVEKTFIQSLGLAVAPFAPVDSLADLEAAVATIGQDGILKTRRLGYDGKGQVRISGGKDLAAAWEAVAGAPSIYEGLVRFDAETSCILARTPSGAMATWDCPANVHRGGILRTSTVPGPLDTNGVARAQAAAATIAEALGHVGVLAVEFFVTGTGSGASLCVNEIAPRVHNSGHWTIEGAATSQFANHIRAVCDWPLGDTVRRIDALEMVNLIGDEASAWADWLSDPANSLHLYGKSETRPGRKMGHVTKPVKAT